MSKLSSSLTRGWERVRQLVESEMLGLQPRLHALDFATSMLHRRKSDLARARLFRLAGFRIGEGTAIRGEIRISGRGKIFGRLVVGTDCSIDTDCVFDLEERITIGDRVTIGPGAMILTSTHELAGAEHRAGDVTRAPVSIGEGSWLGARCVILPGMHVGAGAIVDPGSVVNKPVQPHTRVGGIPATQIEVLEQPGSDTPQLRPE